MVSCEVCGKIIDKSKYYGAVLCSDDCHTKNYWNEKIAIKDDKNVARINGSHYMIGDEKDDNCFRGFNGRKFTIKFNDGQIAETTNLWYQGAIPEAYRDILTDNAKFIKT